MRTRLTHLVSGDVNAHSGLLDMPGSDPGKGVICQTRNAVVETIQ
jgi:hypothetical protein